jgi:4-hydroxy-3-polyprenylbenzoate decarboxylase
MKQQTQQANGRPVQDLRDWLERVQAIGEFVNVTKAVDRDEEMSAITYLLAKQKPSPAVMFDQTKGFENVSQKARLLWNIFGPSIKRIAISLEEHPETSTVELIRRTKDKLKKRIPPQEIAAAQAPIFEHTILGDDIDLNALPIPRHWPLDGGRYAGTADAVITRDPDSGYLNIGTYRMMLQDKNRVGLFLSPGKDARLHITRAWEQGKTLQVAAAWGIDPLFMLVGSQSFPKNVSEYEFAGGIKGQAIDVVKGKTTDLLIPAHAELVIEGEIRPNSMMGEGPFGEFTGYYGKPEAICPFVTVTAMHYRSNPILTNALMADYPSCEQSGFFSIIRSAKIWDDFDKLGIPGIHGVYSHPAAAGGFGMIVVSLEQKYAGHAAQVLALAAQMPGGAYYTKWIVAVDEDVDPTDMDQVIWAMASRSNPVDDIDILRDTWSTPLDPSQNPPEKRPYGSKALINACKNHRFLPSFAKRTRLRKSIYDQVSERWSELGLPGKAPHLTNFETEGAADGAHYHHEERSSASAAQDLKKGQSTPNSSM